MCNVTKEDEKDLDAQNTGTLLLNKSSEHLLNRVIVKILVCELQTLVANIPDQYLWMTFQYRKPRWYYLDLGEGEFELTIEHEANIHTFSALSRNFVFFETFNLCKLLPEQYGLK